MKNFNFYDPCKIVFGCGSLNKLGDYKMPGKKALLLISNGKSTRTNGSFDRTVQELTRAGVELSVFDKIFENPTKDIVMEGATFARENGCDFIVALGGGAVLDSSSVISAMVTNPGDLWDYVDSGTGKGLPFKNKGIPIITITTTSGTGSEINHGGVISNLETNEKIGIGGMAGMFAKYAIVDPELMKTVPPKFTAYQGFDALFHSLEGYISNKHNIMGDMIQRAAIENIGHYLARAVKDGNDIEAREHVAYANTMSGYSMVVTSCISEHSMEHAMSAYHPELPHGAGLIMLSKEYFTFWINKHVCDERFIDMAHFLGMKDASKPEDFITALLELQKACGVDDLKMSDYGIKKEEAMTLAKNARATMMRLFVRDTQETTDEEIAGIYERAYR